MHPSDAVQRAVRQSVQEPLGDVTKDSTSAETQSEWKKDEAEEADTMGPSPTAQRFAMFTTHTADRFGMPADLPRGAPQTLADLAELSPDILRKALVGWTKRRRWDCLSPVQKSAIPFILEFRDVLCIAPTATGKTFTYVFPIMLRLLLDDAVGHPRIAADAAATEDADTPHTSASVDLNRSSVERLLQDQIDRGEVCRYCELRIEGNPLCPMTGVPHPPPPGEDHLSLQRHRRVVLQLEDLSGTAEPRVLILVPTAQLAHQIHGVCSAFHCEYTIRYMVRASSAEEQKMYLRALQGVDVLITTPETLLPALYKQKLSLKKVKTLVLDEVDDLVSLNHFEPLKIVLGALPKGPDRPQRLLFGASLPTSVYHMLRDRMLLPSHRFVLADAKKDNLGHPLRVNTATSGRCEGQSALLTANSAITHVVFMVGRVEKIQTLAALYKSGKLTVDQRTIIFCNSRHNVAYVNDHLQVLVPDVHFTTLTARSSATARDGVLKMFAKGVSTCVICTDVLSRGIDFKDVVYVVNYDMPNEIETWLHRAGRCGRHGMPGYTFTFFQPENARLAKPLVAHLRQHQQLIPPKLHEYAKQSFIEVFKNGLFHHPTRPVRKGDPQNSASVLGRGTPRFPDYRQDALQKHFRPW